MAALQPRGCYRLPLVAPSEALESACGPIANSVQGRAPLSTICLILLVLNLPFKAGTRQCFTSVTDPICPKPESSNV